MLLFSVYCPLSRQSPGLGSLSVRENADFLSQHLRTCPSLGQSFSVSAGDNLDQTGCSIDWWGNSHSLHSLV